MSTAQIYQYMITSINIAIIAVLIVSFIRHYKARRDDVNFHSRMLLLCTCLLLANTFALIQGIYAYFIIKNVIPELLNLGRFADRYCMFFAYLALNKIDQRF